MLASVSKLAEKHVQRQLVLHMESNGLWHNNLHSYRKYLSSTSALAQITDTAIAASEDKKIAVSIAVDESAAFDTVDHEILLKKLEVYKLHKDTIDWVRDYLTGRTEYVTIGAHESGMKATRTGVPQGSIIGPSLFNVYINDLPELVKDTETCGNLTHVSNLELFSPNCKICGNVTIFADDAVYTTANATRQENQDRLNLILDRMQTYMDDNRLSVNPTKTILWEFMLRQKLCKLRDNPPELMTRDNQGNEKLVVVSRNEKCLGGNLQDSMQWQAQLETGQDALIPALRQRLGSLKYLAGNIPRKCKILLINGLIQGKINYLLPLYGGTQEKYKRKIQAIMNNAIRWATGGGKRTKTLELAKSVNWLTLDEMTKLHTLTFTWKIVNLRKPRHLYDNINLEAGNNLTTTIPRLQNSESSLRWRMCKLWNEMNYEMRNMKSLPRFKRTLKSWIKSKRVPENDPDNPILTTPVPALPSTMTSTATPDPALPSTMTATRDNTTTGGDTE